MKPGSLALAVRPGPTGRSLHTDFLPAALEVVETPASSTARVTAASIAGFFAVALAWSIVGEVDIIASAPGTVIPAGKSKLVQPLEAGIIAAIRVDDGDHVAAGQPVIVLDSTEAVAARDRIARDLRQARLDVAGLSALKRDIDTSEGLFSFAPPVGTPPREADLQRLAISARRQEQVEKLADLAQQVAAKAAEDTENTAGIVRLHTSLPYVQQKRDMYRALKVDQLAQVPAWADAEQAFVEQQLQIAVLSRHTATIAAQRESLLQQLAGARATYARDVLKDLTDAEQKVGELTQEFSAASEKARETVLRAPIAGTVQQLAVHTVGGVVTAAQPLMKIVPDRASVLIEATVENKDVGFVHAGQDVEVKVETFSFTRYGLLRGHVVDVSRDAAETDQRAAKLSGADETSNDITDEAHKQSLGSGYIVYVALDRNVLTVDGTSRTLEPGMGVTAEIETGHRNVISYLMSPLTRAVASSMRER